MVGSSPPSHGRRNCRPPFYYAECGVANKLKRLIDTSSKDLFEEDVNIEKIVRRTGIRYDDVQVAAIKQAVQSKVMVLTGGPGTGKTTTTIGIIAALQSMGLRILVSYNYFVCSYYSYL